MGKVPGVMKWLDIIVDAIIGCITRFSRKRVEPTKRIPFGREHVRSLLFGECIDCRQADPDENEECPGPARGER